MRVPSPEKRLCLLPEQLLESARPRAVAFGEAMAELYGVDAEDMVEATVLGLWYAWETYDPQAGTKWSTWLRRCMGWFCSDCLRDWGKLNTQARQTFLATHEVVSLQDVALDRNGASGGPQVLIEDTVTVPAVDLATDLGLTEEARGLLDLMLPREREIFIRRFYLQQDKPEIARHLGISLGRVSQIEATARSRVLFHHAKLEAASDPLQAVLLAEKAMRVAVEPGAVLEIAVWLADFEAESAAPMAAEGVESPYKALQSANGLSSPAQPALALF